MDVTKVLTIFAACGVTAATCAQSPPTDKKVVTWEQYQAAMRRIEALESASNAGNNGQPAGDTQEQLFELADRLDELESFTDDLRIGTTDFLVTGYAASNFTSNEDGTSSFSTNFNPIFLWRLSDRASFAGELEFELGDTDTATNLEFLEISYVINDYLTFRAGKILTPLSFFKENLHSAWINKLPDQPLFAGGGARLIPTSSLAFELRGGAPINDSMRLFYSAYVANGPRLVTTGSKAGQLSFDNFTDVNSNKTFGGRIGIFLTPELDMSYAFNYGDVGTSGTIYKDISALIQDISIGYVVEKDEIGGRLEARAEYIHSDVDDAVIGGVLFDNTRSGGYAQVSYRPTLSSNTFKDFEGVFRFDWLDNPSDAGVASKSYDEERYTFGINYWVNPSTVFKVAYRFDNIDDPTNSKQDNDALLLQVAMGF